MATPFGYDPACHCKAQVRVAGRTVIVKRLEQEITYGGLMEGVPTRETNDRKLEEPRRAARRRGAHLIEPVRRSYLRTEGDMDGLADLPRPPEWLPMVRVSMTLWSRGGAEREEAYASLLHVVFFQDDFAPPLDDGIAQALQNLDWDREAEDDEG
jgi:hypothetical protein